MSSIPAKALNCCRLLKFIDLNPPEFILVTLAGPSSVGLPGAVLLKRMRRPVLENLGMTVVPSRLRLLLSDSVVAVGVADCRLAAWVTLVVIRYQIVTLALI